MADLRLPTYCYDAARPPVLSDKEEAERGAQRIDRLIREFKKEHPDGR